MPCFQRTLAALVLLGVGIPLGACSRPLPERFYPATLTTVEARQLHVAPRVVRVRAYADARWQSRRWDWEREVRRQLEAASGVSRAAFAVEFELESARPWDLPDSGAGNGIRLDVSLEALEALDPADDADVWVVGFMGHPVGASAPFQVAGKARWLGRHMVLRPPIRAGKRREHGLGYILPPAKGEWDTVSEARLAHYGTVLLLHHWGHTVGALHGRHYDSIMDPAYSRRIDRFGPLATDIIRAVLAAPTPPGTSPAERDGIRRAAARAWFAAHPTVLRGISGPDTYPCTEAGMADAATRREMLGTAGRSAATPRPPSGAGETGRRPEP